MSTPPVSARSRARAWVTLKTACLFSTAVGSRCSRTSTPGPRALPGHYPPAGHVIPDHLRDRWATRHALPGGAETSGGIRRGLRLTSRLVIPGSSRGQYVPAWHRGNHRERYMELGNFSISLSVKDIEASKAFYEKFGFRSFMGNALQKWLIMKNGE